ncbi:MAG: CHAT domain-containing protein [Planctomycetota bacterium]|nr:CHAT domain-containing protein [Planctomycetota bacterium]
MTPAQEANLRQEHRSKRQLGTFSDKAVESIAKLLGEQDYDKGLEFCRMVLGERSPQYARVLNNVATLYYQRGEYRKAVSFLEQACGIQRKHLGEQDPDYATCLHNLAGVYVTIGEYAQAEPLYRQALQIRRKVAGEQHPEYAMGLTMLAQLYYYAGDYARMEPPLQKALELQARILGKRDPDYAQSLIALAALCTRIGEPAHAERLLQQALSINQQVLGERHFSYAAALSQFASLYLSMREYGKAEPLVQKALELQRELLGEQRMEYAVSLTQLAELYSSRGEYAKAESVYREATQIVKQVLGEQHPHYAVCLHNLAIASCYTEGYAKAKPLLHEASENCRKVLGEQHPDYAISLEHLAIMHSTTGEYAKAMTLATDAARIELRNATNVVAGLSEAQAINFVSQNLRPPSVLLSLQGGVNVEELYEQVWARRGLIQQCVGRRQRQIQQIPSPKAREQYQEYLVTRQSLAALIVAPASPNPAGAQDALKRLEELGDKKERLERQLAAQLPEFGRQIENSRRSHRELVGQLPDGVALVDLLYCQYREQARNRPEEPGLRVPSWYTAFLLSRDRPVTRIEIGPTEPIDQAISAWRAAPYGAMAVHAPALRRLLWEPIEKALPPGIHAIYLCPDGDLTRLPWGALPGRASGRVLLDDYALAVVPSGQFLLEQLTAASSANDAGRLLVVGGVSYDAQPRQATAATEMLATRWAAMDEGGVRWRQLEGSNREVAAVVALAGNRQHVELTGAEASSSRVVQELPNASWAHFATHGFFADKKFRSALQFNEGAFEERIGLFRERLAVAGRNPLVLSGLILAGANLSREKDELGLPKGDGGILTAEAVASLDLTKMDLVVLSACETGLGDVAGGEGVFGLQRAFHVAGARNVVASLWKVDDKVTAVLMGLFYHNLWREKMPPIEALRQAQLYVYRHPEQVETLAATRGPAFDKAVKLPKSDTQTPMSKTASTGHWAGFVLSGSGQ